MQQAAQQATGSASWLEPSLQQRGPVQPSKPQGGGAADVAGWGAHSERRLNNTVVKHITAQHSTALVRLKYTCIP